jgi:DNA-binding MurR/RpiR family transcriptional regulator
MRKNPDGEGEVVHTRETIGEEVRDRLGDMTPSERRVARTLLATYPTAGLESLPQLADAADVTGPTVLRFVRKIGYDGYPDFQRSLRLEVQARTEGLYSLFETKAATQDDLVLNRSLDAFRRALEETFSATSLEEDLTDVVSLLSDRKLHLWFVGGRFSQLLASYLCLLIRRLRPGCSMIGETPDARVLDSLELSRKSVLFLFDYRRYQPDTIAVGRVAASRGAAVVVFTDPWLSPAVEFARRVFISHADSASPFDSMLGGFALAELIAAKAVTAAGQAGHTRVGELEAVGMGDFMNGPVVEEPDVREGGGRR